MQFSAEEYIAVSKMAEVIKNVRHEGHIRFIAQILGLAPCPTCDYLARHCRCLPVGYVEGPNLNEQ